MWATFSLTEGLKIIVVPLLFARKSKKCFYEYFMLCFIVSAIDEKKVLAMSFGLVIVSSLSRESNVGILEAPVFCRKKGYQSNLFQNIFYKNPFWLKK